MIFTQKELKKAFLLFREGFDYEDAILYFKNKKTEVPDSTKLDMIIRSVSNDFSISEDSFKTNYRGRQVVDARAIYYYLARLFTDASYSSIGNKVNRDHATAINGYKQLTDLVDSGDKDLKIKLKNIKKIYNSYIYAHSTI